MIVGFKANAQKVHSCGGHCGDVLRKPVLLGSPELHTSCGNPKYSDLLIDVVILLHDNVQPHMAQKTQNLLQTFGWEKLNHFPYKIWHPVIKEQL